MKYGYAMGTEIGKGNEENVEKITSLCETDLDNFYEGLRSMVLVAHKKGAGTIVKIDYDSIVGFLYNKMESHGFTIEDCYYAVKPYTTAKMNDLSWSESQISESDLTILLITDVNQNYHVKIVKTGDFDCPDGITTTYVFNPK